MCCILYFPVGSSIDYEKLKNCVHNNSHSYGVILKNSNHKKLEVIRKCEWDKNETPIDPGEVYDLIDTNKEFERYVHLRWRTDGPIDLDNTHPFPVYISNKRSVYFMHNGILHNYKPDNKSTSYIDGVKVEREAEDISDSKKFVDKLLTPLLARFVGPAGKGDITDPMLADIINKYWSTGSKGILISNDQDPMFINMRDWIKKTHNNKDYFASNDSYFDKITRGPEYERIRKEEEEARKKKDQSGTRFHGGSNTGQYSRITTELKHIPLNPREPMSKELKDMFNEYKIWEEEGMASLDSLTPVEVEGLVKDYPDDATNLIICLTGYYSDIYKRYSRITEHLKKSENNAS